jgi:hypothetical protein
VTWWHQATMLLHYDSALRDDDLTEKVHQARDPSCCPMDRVERGYGA